MTCCLVPRLLILMHIQLLANTSYLSVKPDKYLFLPFSSEITQCPLDILWDILESWIWELVGGPRNLTVYLLHFGGLFLIIEYEILFSCEVFLDTLSKVSVGFLHIPGTVIIIPMLVSLTRQNCLRTEYKLCFIPTIYPIICA